MSAWVVWLIVAAILGVSEVLTLTLALGLTEVTRHSGRVRIGGEEWTARPYDPTITIPQGADVDVLAIEGVTALVHPREDPWPISP